MTAISAMSPAKLAMHHRRKRTNVIALSLAFGAMAFGVFWLLWILYETAHLGGGGLNVALFTESTPAAMSDGGGLANALYGSAVMVLVATLIARIRPWRWLAIVLGGTVALGYIVQAIAASAWPRGTRIFGASTTVQAERSAVSAATTAAFSLWPPHTE